MTLLTVLLVLWSLNQVASEVYHVTTNPLDPSCTGPCLSLSQFAINSSHYIYSNTTLIFLPGTHYLNTALTLSNVDNLEMRSENFTAHIVCENYSNIHFNHSHKVKITKLEFIGCGRNQIKCVAEFVVQDTKFNGQGDTGTSLELIETTAQIVNNTFVSNTGRSYRCILFDPNHSCIGGYVFIGGAIISTNSTIDISLSKFEYNRADLGGAIFAEQYSIIRVSGSQFINNTATLSGVLECDSSMITIEESEFHRNSGGGILQSSDSTITIEASAFYENNSTGWGVVVSESSTTTIKDSEFCNTYKGQALDSYDSAIVIDGTKFRGHDSSGTALLLINTTAEIVNSTFVSNSRGTYRQCVVFFEDKYHHGCTVLHEYIGGAILVTNSTIDISQSRFEDNGADFGGAIFAEGHSNISMSGNLFINNSAIDGGVLLSYGSTITIETSEFHYNSAVIGGVIYSSNCTITINASEFHDNTATWGSGVLESIAGSKITIKASRFHNNSAAIGGVLRSCNGVDVTIMDSNMIFIAAMGSTGSTITIKASEFHDNTAASLGGVIYSSNSAIAIDGSSFINNSSPIGAVIYATNGSKIQHHNYLLIDKNLANNYAVIYFSDTEFREQQDSKYFTFSNNLGSLVAFNSNITFINNVMFVNNQPLKATTNNSQEGGAMTLFQSNVFFDGICSFEDNYAENGGAIHSTESKIFVNGNVTLLHNTASKNGGGVYLSTSELNCQQKSTFILFGNSAAQKGGGLHAISSSIKASSAITYVWRQYTGTRMNFTNNAAKRGGGLSLEANAKLYILKYDQIMYYYDPQYPPTSTGDTNTTTFINNSADYGGAVYVDDNSNSGTCVDDPKTECFIQVLALYENPISKDFKTQNVYFSQNYANISGSTLYGGLLDRCAVSQFAEVNYKYGYIYKDNGDGIAYFKNISIPTYEIENSCNEVVVSTNISVASDPVGVCLCINNVHDCTHQSHVEIKKGETFTVSLVAIDQTGQPVNATIQSFLNFAGSSGLAEGQLSRKIPEKCTDLIFNVVSEHDSENLILYASDGPCKDAELSKATVEVSFRPCTCPIGLQVSERNEINCTCECHEDISQYVEKCDSHSGSLVKQPHSRAWISYINDTDLTGYLVYPNCPFDYCLSTSPPVYLNQSDGDDAQCAFNRSSLLCGSCQLGLSLSLGSSRCLPCPSYWPALFVSITIAAILAGIALVTLLLILNMTVAVGSLNGLIFYANVVYANKSILMPFQRTTFITVFISWLNLELGIDTCYFPGMDTYIKTWLQLAFPAYVILLVVLVIIISSYYTKFSNIIGKKDPVATLATLILLSYAKLLEICFKSLSVGILEYPDGANEPLWLPDATIKYLSGRHIPLFIVSILILLVGLVYTTILFSWQWLLYLPGWRIFKLSRNPRIQTFIETYHTPYNPKHRHWTGLLLTVRVVLYLIAAVNVSNEPTIALIAIAFSVCCIFLLKAIIEKRLYRKRLLEVLETLFFFNILFFILFTWYYIGKEYVHREAIAYTSVTITIIVLLLIIFYHTYTYTTVFSKIKKTKLGRVIDQLLMDNDPKPAPRLHLWSPPPDDDIHRFDEQLGELASPVNTDDYATIPLLRPPPAEPTYSVVEVHKPHDLTPINPVQN